MIRVTGAANLRVPFSIDLDMTEDEFDGLPDSKLEKLLDASIDWHEACRSAEIDDLDVYDIEEIGEGGDGE